MDLYSVEKHEFEVYENGGGCRRCRWKLEGVKLEGVKLCKGRR